MKLDLQLFASSGSVDTTIAYSSYGNSWGTTSWSQTSNNNGTSTINYSVVFHITTSNYRYVWFNSYVTAYANGSQIDRKSIDSGYISCGNNTTIFSGSFTITDGASIRFVTDLRIGDSQVGYTSDQTWTSDTYKNTISSNQTSYYLRPVALDIPIAINIVNPSATNEIVITTWDLTITKTVNNGIISLTSAEVISIIEKNNYSSQIGGTITLNTKVNGTTIGTDPQNLTWWYITEDSTTKPTITNATITVSEDNSTVAALTNSEKYIRGYSRQNVSIIATFTGQYGATIREVYANGVLMTGSGNTYQATLSESEVSNFIGVTAIDTRGFVSEASSINTYVVDYTPPVLSNVVLERRDGVSEEVELSLTLKLWNGNYRQGDLARYDNTVYSFKYLVKEHSASTYENEVNDTTRFRTAISGQSVDNIVLSDFRVYSDSSNNNFDFGTAYDVLIEVFDGLETVQFNSSGQVPGVVDDGLVLDSYSKSSTGYKYAINGIVDETLGDGLQVNGKFYLNGTELTPPTTLKVGHARYGRSSSQTIPANTVTRYILNSVLEADTANKTSLSNGEIIFDASVKMATLTMAIQSNGSNSWLNIYPHLWGVSTQHKNDFEGVVTLCYTNTSNTQGNFAFEVYLPYAETMPYDNYWNYIDVTYLYED